MLSFHGTSLTLTEAQVALSLGHKCLTNSNTKEDDDCLKRHAKTEVNSAEDFLGIMRD